MKILMSSTLCIQLYFRMPLTFPSLQDSLCNCPFSSVTLTLHDPVQDKMNQTGC